MCNGFVLVRHRGGIARALEKWCGESLIESRPISGGALRALVEAANTGVRSVGWLDDEMKEHAPPGEWPRWLDHGLQLLHGGRSLDQCLLSLGWIFGDDPALMRPPRVGRFPTWLISADAGCSAAELWRDVPPELYRDDFQTALLRWGHSAVTAGITMYRESRFRTGSGVEEPGDAGTRDDRLASRFVRALPKRYVLFWIGARFAFERRMPPMSVWRGLFRRSPELELTSISALSPLPGNPTGEESVDVVVPTLGRPQPLRDVLLDLAQQTHPVKHVFIVEQLPTDDIRRVEVPSGLPFGVSVESVDWLGACRARNHGLQNTTGDYVLFLDDDVRFAADLVSGLLGAARAYRVGAVNAAVHSSEQATAAQRPERSRPWQWRSFAGCAALVARRSIERSGGFDERFEGGYGEDTDFGLRLRRTGTDVLLDPRVKVLHLRASAGGFRYRYPHPWAELERQPRPSPTILLWRRLHLSVCAQRAYRVSYLLRTFFANPWLSRLRALRDSRRAFDMAEHWCEWLWKKQTTSPEVATWRPWNSVGERRTEGL